MKIITLIAVSVLMTVVALAQSFVPVSKESHHHLRFENEYVRVFDVIVPPGDATLFHLHPNDYAFVSIGDARLKAEELGKQPGDLTLKNGDVRFTKAPVTHRVTNVGSTPFHNLTVEILRKPVSSAPRNPLPRPSTHTVILENERVAIVRHTLEPGQSTGVHSHAAHSLAIVVSEATLEIETPGQQKSVAVAKAGEYSWRDAPVTHSVRNRGKSRFEAVEIEWK